MIKANRTRLPELGDRLRELGVERPPSYQELYGLILNGSLPATRERTRIYVDDPDAEALAERLKAEEIRAAEHLKTARRSASSPRAAA